MEYKNFILLIDSPLKDRLFKRLCVYYLDKDNTILSALKDSGITKPVQINNLFINNETGYTVNKLRFNLYDKDIIFDKVFSKLHNSLMIKYPGYLNYYKEFWEDGIIKDCTKTLNDDSGNIYHYLSKSAVFNTLSLQL